MPFADLKPAKYYYNVVTSVKFLDELPTRIEEAACLGKNSIMFHRLNDNLTDLIVHKLQQANLGFRVQWSMNIDNTCDVVISW